MPKAKTILLSDWYKKEAARTKVMVGKSDRGFEYNRELAKRANYLQSRALELKAAGKPDEDEDVKIPQHQQKFDVHVCPECGNTPAFGCASGCPLQVAKRRKA